MAKLPNTTIPKNDDENVEEIPEEPEVKEDIFKEEEPEKTEPIDIPKTNKRTKRMTESAKKQLDDARKRSIETRKANSLKRKQEKELENNKKYIDEIESLRNQLEEYKNKPEKEPKIIEKVIYKEPNITESYKFSMEDLEYYANEKIKKLKEIETETKQKKRQDVINKYMWNLR